MLSRSAISFSLSSEVNITVCAPLAESIFSIAASRVWDCVEINCPYALLEQIKLRLAAQSAVMEDISYGADIVIRALLPQANTAPVSDAIRELSAGKVMPKVRGQVYRAAPV